MAEQPDTSGVQQLIDRLSHEGVAEGERQAEKIIAEAQQKADDIVDLARQQANEILAQARHEADQLVAGGEEALKLACRDAVRDLASRLHEGFRARLQELLQHQLKDAKLLKRMILEIAGKAKIDEDAEVTVLLPPEAIREEDVRKRIQAGDEDALTEFVEGLLGDEIRQGFALKLGDTDQTGLRVQVVNQNVEIDFTEKAITELLAQHLLPRFRAIMH
jgi:V/A-type H+-transporting ATPase subunit E